MRDLDGRNSPFISSLKSEFRKPALGLAAERVDGLMIAGTFAARVSLGLIARVVAHGDALEACGAQHLEDLVEGRGHRFGRARAANSG